MLLTWNMMPTYFIEIRNQYQHSSAFSYETYLVVDLCHPTLLSTYVIVTPVVYEINQSPRDQDVVCFVFIKHVPLWNNVIPPTRDAITWDMENQKGEMGAK